MKCFINYQSELFMKLLVIASYRKPPTPVASFVMDQVKAYKNQDICVNVLVPIPIGRKLYDGKLGGKFLEQRTIDGVRFFFLRYLSLGNVGEKIGLNYFFALCSIIITLPELLKFLKADVIQAHTLGTISLIGWSLKLIYRIPLVVTVHGSDVEIPFAKGLHWKIKFWADKADAVITVSSKLAMIIKECGVQKPVHTILNGFCIENLPTRYTKKPFSVIQVCNLVQSKCVDITIHAFAKFKENHDDAFLTIVGQGPCRHRLEELCETLNIINSVVFTGQLPNNDVLSLLAETQFFCMPSVHEGFGIAYLEAMAAGCITIGTEREGISDLIRTGDNGFLVPPYNYDKIVDCMEWCVAHPDESGRIVNCGTENAFAQTWATNVQLYKVLLGEILGK